MKKALILCCMVYGTAYSCDKEGRLVDENGNIIPLFTHVVTPHKDDMNQGREIISSDTVYHPAC